MEPVEIEFLMQDKISAGVENITRATETLGEKVGQVTAGIQAKIAGQRTEIRRIETDLQSLEKQFARLAPGPAQEEMKAELLACKKCLDEEKVSLQGLEAEYEKNKAAARQLTAELGEMQAALAQMRLAGRQTTPEYEELSQKADALKDTLGDVQTQANKLAHDNAGLQGLISGASGVSGAFSVATNIMGIFAAENQNLQKIQARVQSILAVTIGLQQVYNALNKDSAFRLVTVARAKEMLTAATGRLAVALGISNVAAKTLMATLTLGLSVAIGAVIYLWDKFSSEQARAREEAKKLNEAIAGTSSKSITDFKQLQTQWNALGDSLEEKEKFITANRDAFTSLGVEINSVYDAENLLVGNADKFIESIRLKAKAAALMEIAAEAYRESIQEMLEAEAMPDKTKIIMGGGPLAPPTTLTVDNPAKAKKQKKAKELEEKADNLVLQSLDTEQQAHKNLQEANIKNVDELVNGSVGAIEAIIEQKRKTLKKLTNKKDYEAAEKEIAAEEKKLNAITNKNRKAPAPPPVNNLSDTELKVRQKIEFNTLDLQEEGYQKEREQAKLRHAREVERINREETERLARVAELRKAGVKVEPGEESTIKAQADTQRIQSGLLRDKEVGAIDKKEQQEQDEKYKQLLEPYRTYTEQRLAIEEKFRQDKEKLKAGGASEENIEIADQQEQDALTALDTTFASKEESFKVLLSRITSMSLGQLEGALRQAQAALKKSESKDGKNSKDAVALRAKIAVLTQEIKTTKAEQDADGEDKVKKWDRTSTALKKCKSEVDNIIGSMDFLDESTKNALQTASNIAGGTIAMINGIKSLGVGAAQSLSAVEKASVILMIIGTAVQIVTAIFSMASAAEDRHQKALAEVAAAKLAMQREYNLLIMQQNLLFEEGKSIFGEQEILKATNAVEVYRRAIESYKTELQGVAPEQTYFERLTQDAFGTYAKRLDDYKKGIAGLANIGIITGHKKTGLFGWGKGKDVYSGILEVYPDLIDGENRLNLERAKTILDTQKMSDENKNLLQSLIDLQTQADEAVEVLRDFLEDTFGDLGTGAVDAITDSIKNGTDMWENFGKTGAAVLEQLGEKAAYSLFFAKYFQKMQNDLEKLYGSGKSEEDIARESMNLVSSFFSSIGGQMDAAQEWLGQWKEEANKKGFDLWANGDAGNASQNAQAGAFTTLTQDQGSKLEGMFTAVQMHTASIDMKIDDIAELTFKAFLPLQEIAKNTSHCKRLEKIEETLLEIKRDGLKVK